MPSVTKTVALALGQEEGFTLATDPNRFSIACRATGPVSVPDKLPEKAVVFGASASPFFKEIRVSRLFDAEKRVLVYVVWSTVTLSTGGSARMSTKVSVSDRPISAAAATTTRPLPNTTPASTASTPSPLTT